MVCGSLWPKGSGCSDDSHRVSAPSMSSFMRGPNSSILLSYRLQSAFIRHFGYICKMSRIRQYTLPQAHPDAKPPKHRVARIDLLPRGYGCAVKRRESIITMLASACRTIHIARQRSYNPNGDELAMCEWELDSWEAHEDDTDEDELPVVCACPCAKHVDTPMERTFPARFPDDDGC
eukprot:GHVQ01042337.1.p1 GENE.GHVQ01042337.1~~GHVQ01042337.1.p1  ORF type:complete len:177 (-),score=8.28 GHVQ01042337.1:376-906(-)